ETHGKCVELLRDILPSVQRVAVLGNAGDPSNKQIIEQIQLAGRTTAIKIDPIVMVSGADQFDAAFAKMAQESSDAVVVHASLPPKNIADLRSSTISRRQPRYDNSLRRVGWSLTVLWSLTCGAGVQFLFIEYCKAAGPLTFRWSSRLNSS